MQQVDYPTLAPSVCVVCESVPPATPFVDTLRTFDPNGYTHLNGRKYICQNCVSDAAQAIGLLEAASAPFQAQVVELTDQVEQLKADIESYGTITAAVASLTNRPVVQVESNVADVIAQYSAQFTARANSAQSAQDAVAAQAAAEAAGAAKQAELDQQVADAQQAASAQAVVPAPEEATAAPSDTTATGGTAPTTDTAPTDAESTAPVADVPESETPASSTTDTADPTGTTTTPSA